MKGQAPAFWIGAETLVKGLFDKGGEEATLLALAAANEIELHASKSVWNSLLWLLANQVRDAEGNPMVAGPTLASMKARLPVHFH